MDYNSGFVEINYPQSNVPVQNNTTTTLALPATINFNQLEIISNELPLAIINEPYEFTFASSGGTPPFKWDILRHFEQNTYSGEFPEIIAEKLNLSDTIRGIAMNHVKLFSLKQESCAVCAAKEKHEQRKSKRF